MYGSVEVHNWSVQATDESRTLTCEEEASEFTSYEEVREIVERSHC